MSDVATFTPQVEKLGSDGFVITDPSSIRWYGVRAGIERAIIECGMQGIKNFAIGVGPGHVCIFNAKSMRAYAAWDIETDGKPMPEKEIVELFALIKIAKRGIPDGKGSRRALVIYRVTPPKG